MTGMRVFSGWWVPSPGKPSYLDRMARRIFHSIMSKILWGRLNLVEDNKRLTVGRQTDDCPFEATIFVKKPNFYRQILVSGSVGARESFALSDWSADNLTGALRIILLNQSIVEQALREWLQVSSPACKLLHFARHKMDSSKKQIILNMNIPDEELYSLFLGVNQNHTCGIFGRPGATLAEAASAAHERLCRKLRLSADDNVLEIGSAWGGFASHAAGRYSCHIVAAVESKRQIELSRQKIKTDKVDDHVRIVHKDFRQMKGRFDKLVSIETISSMSRRNLDTFFMACNRLLKDDGVMALQTVIRTDNSCGRLAGDIDIAGPFIQPGEWLPSLTTINRALEKNTDLRLVHLEDLTPHYAVTMRRWRERFYANVDRARDLGISEHVLRRWAFDLCFGEAGFVERHFGAVQMIFAKSLSRHNPILPPLASKFGVILQKRKNEIDNWLT